MTKLADAVDAINHYTGTEAETERILDLALPVMQLHAYRFHYFHPRFDADDLVANMQLSLLKYLHGKRPDVIYQSYFSRLLYYQMITSVRCQYRDFRQKSKHLEYVNNCVINRSNEYIPNDTMSDVRITIDELDVKDIVKDVLCKLLIDQYEVSDLTEYYNLSVARICQLFDVGMKNLCSRFELVPQRHYSAPAHNGLKRRKPKGFYIRRRSEKESKIIADYQAGMNMETMERKYDKSRNTILKIVKRNGVTIRRTINKMKEQSIVRDYLNGMTYKDIAEKYCYNISTLPVILKRNGIEPNRRGKKAA